MVSTSISLGVALLNPSPDEVIDESEYRYVIAIPMMQQNEADLKEATKDENRTFALNRLKKRVHRSISEKGVSAKNKKNVRMTLFDLMNKPEMSEKIRAGAKMHVAAEMIQGAYWRKTLRHVSDDEAAAIRAKRNIRRKESAASLKSLLTGVAAEEEETIPPPPPPHVVLEPVMAEEAAAVDDVAALKKAHQEDMDTLKAKFEKQIEILQKSKSMGTVS